MNKKKCLKIFFAVFGFLFFIQQFALCSSVYVSAGSNLVEVDLNSGQTRLIASLADYTDQSPRGVARNSEGEIYVSVSNNWSNRILKIIPNGSQEPTIEYFTSPISFQYGFGQLGFNSKGHLFAAGDKNQVIYEFDQQGNKVSDIRLDGGYSSYKNNVGLFTNGDILYSVGYFSPRVLSRYDTSGEVITGGVYDELTFSSEFYPASLTQSHNGNLAIGGGRGSTLLWEYDLTTKTTSLLFDCIEFGRSTFVQYDPFSNSYIVPSNNGLTLLNPDGSFIKEITGPDLQNSRSISKPFPEPTTVVAVDIKPGSCPNPLNVKSKGVLPVAILGTADYDITTIDIASIRLAGVEPLRSGYEDVAAPVLPADDCNCTEAGPDGFLDLTLKFKTQRIVEAVGDVNHGDGLMLELTGVLYDEMPIEGADCILIRGRHKPINPADINKDGMVNAVDFAIFLQNWLLSSIVDE
ncbi:MAG: NHL repeat-containing protein [Planctomycetota bacterium]|jgi:hypothetical protein